MHRSTLALTALALAATASLVVPARGEAQQLWKKIKDQAERKLEARKAKADSTTVARVGQTVDSTLERTGRAVDTAVSKAAGAADAAVDRTGRVVSSAAGALAGKDDEEERLAADLVDGRAVLPGIRFEGTSERLAATSEPHLERLAKLLEAQSGVFLIEGHVDDGGNADDDLVLSEKRAAAVKARLVAAGVPAERLFAMGLGATRPPAEATGGRARIEVARMK
jgi:outer membrane protein OmpA-like peptidoglycan-associated protein